MEFDSASFANILPAFKIALKICHGEKIVTKHSMQILVLQTRKFSPRFLWYEDEETAYDKGLP